ncbi:MAG: L-lactate dehydrogenase [Candidatus Moraniibacteriota bacterium]|nr:MAG: L-lactate dehydrogenase [Candidatus Moranbacteria bacterium]
MNKITIVGAGVVGATSAYSLIAKDVAEELVLVDINKELAEAEAMDLQHSVSFFGSTQVRAGSYEDFSDSQIVVFCAGSAQKEGQSRLDLIQDNARIVQKVVPEIFSRNPDAMLIMVTNPVDVLTYLAIQMFPEKKRQIIGTGTMLDSSRFRYLLGAKLRVNSKSITAYIVGEHGDSEVPYWSTATTGSMSLDTCRLLTKEEKDEIFSQAKNAAYAIIKGKQATYYAIGAVVSHLCNVIIKDKRVILPISHFIEGEFGISDVCLSIPVVVGKEGVAGHLCVVFSDEELTLLKKSADTLKEVIASLDLTSKT